MADVDRQPRAPASASPVFGFAGFYSKDIILESAFAAQHGPLRLRLLARHLAAALMTAFYSWRLHS